MNQSKLTFLLVYAFSIVVALGVIDTAVNAAGEGDKNVKKIMTTKIKLSDDDQQRVESLGQSSSKDLLEMKSIIDKRLGADPNKSLIAIGSPKLMKVNKLKADNGTVTNCFLDYNYDDLHCISADCGHRWTCWHDQ